LHEDLSNFILLTAVVTKYFLAQKQWKEYLFLLFYGNIHGFVLLPDTFTSKMIRGNAWLALT